jgi:hypothetical protein
MRRLRELSDLGDMTEADSLAIAELRRLAHAVGDIEPPPGAQARVRSALAEIRDRRSSRASWQAPVLAVLVLVTAAIGAVVSTTRRPSVPRPEPVISVATVAMESERRVTNPAVSSNSKMTAVPATPEITPLLRVAPARETPRSDQTRRAPHVSAVRSEAPPSPRLAPPARIVNPVAPSHTPEPAVTASAETASAETGPAETTSAATEPEEAALVLEAMRALRQAHDVEAAARLLNEYRARFPQGDLAEEALALAIEAHAALHDSTAITLADEYLQRFPGGRFRDIVARAKLASRGAQ